MKTLLFILIATIIDSLIGFVGVFSLWIKKKLLQKTLGYLVAYSAGALLGGAFFHLLAESVEVTEPFLAMGFALLGFVAFLLIEGFFHSHLCEKCTAHPFTYTMLFGDAIHNFIDGLVIAASFFVSIPLGIVTTLMILGHETPQELGLFGTLVYGGHNKTKAMFYSFAAQSTVIIGGIIGYIASSVIEPVSVFIIPFAAGGFIYIASSDLVPEMHKMYEGNVKKSIKVLGAFAVGILFMLALKVFLGA